MSCGVGHRHGSDPSLLWPWHRPADTAPVGPLAWESPYATGVALEKAKRQKKKEGILSQLCLLNRKPPIFKESTSCLPDLFIKL